MTLSELRAFINTYIRNDAKPSFNDLRLNTALISLTDNMEALVVGAGGEPTIAAGTTAQYWRGDKTWQTLNKTAVGLSNVQNVDQTNATNLTSGTIDAARYGALTIPIAAINATGTPGATTVLYGNGTWGTPTIPDGDYGGITIGGSGTTMTINDGVVTYAMFQDVDQNRIIGRTASGTGPVTALTGADITPLLSVFNSGDQGVVPASGGDPDEFLSADGTFKLVPGAGGVADADYGDITVSSSGSIWTIDPQAVTFSKIQNITQARLLGRYTASTGVMQEITIGSGLSLNATTGELTASGGGGGTWGSITGTLSSQTDLQAALDAKQATLVSGTNIKTINSVSLLGSGDVVTPNFANTDLTLTAHRGHDMAGYSLVFENTSSTDWPNSWAFFRGSVHELYCEHLPTNNFVRIEARAESTDAWTFIDLRASASGGSGTQARIRLLPQTGKVEVDGDLQLLNYTTAVAGTAVYSLNVDASGNVITGSVGGGGYTDEQAQDAVGAMVSGEFTYTDATPLLEINAINWSKITGEPSTLAGYGITDGIDAVLAINKVTNDFIDWQEASDASGSGVYSQKITPSNYNTAYTSHGRASLYTTGWMRFNGVNASGRPNVVRSDGYNINMGGSRILTDEAGFRTALESHFEQGADDLFEWFHEVTTYSGGTERPLGLYTNKTTGATAVNFLATASVSFQTVAGVNLFGFNSTGNYAFEGTGGTLTLYNGTTSDEAYQLQVDTTNVYHNSFGLVQQFDSKVSITGHSSGVYQEITDAYNGSNSTIYISLAAVTATKSVLNAVGDVDGWMGVTLQNTDSAGFSGLRFLNAGGAGMRLRHDQFGRIYIGAEGGSDRLGLTNIGEFFLYSIPTATTANVLYYNTGTGEITYGAAGGGTGDMLTTATNTMTSAGKIIFPTLSDNSNLRVGPFEFQGRAVNESYWFENAYFDGTNYKYRANGWAELFYFGSGSFAFFNAASGTAGGNATMDERFSVGNTGNVKIATAGAYLNWGATAGSSGYGFRDNGGTMEFKNSGGSWTAFGAGGSTETASNGLTKVGNDIQLGGTLSAATNIDGSGTNYKLTLTNTRLQTDKGADVAAANDLTLGGDGNMFTITGNTQINAITSANWQAGSEITLLFTGTPTLKHNTAGGAGTAKLLMGGSSDFTAAADDVVQFVFDGTNWHETYRKNAAVGGRYNFSNGLTETGINVKLGGTLTANTTIATAGFNLILSTSTALATPLIVNHTTGMGIDINGTTGTGLDVSTTTGTAISAQTTGSNYAVYAKAHNASTNSVIDGIMIQRTLTSGTAANGIGIGLNFGVQSDSGSVVTAARITSTLSDVTNASPDGTLNFFAIQNNVSTMVMTVENGLVIYNTAAAPTTNVTNGIRLYSEDVSSSAELKVRDEAGNITTISPHNFSGIPDGPSEKLAWAHYGEKDGEFVNVDMLKLARILENEYGWKYGQLVYTGKK